MELIIMLLVKGESLGGKGCKFPDWAGIYRWFDLGADSQVLRVLLLRRLAKRQGMVQVIGFETNHSAFWWGVNPWGERMQVSQLGWNL